MSRKAVGAQIQAITYSEFLPILVGPNAIPVYSGYDASVNATLSNEFANAAYWVGHTLLSPQIQLVDTAGNFQGSVALRDAFFDPAFAQENGIDVLLKGLSAQRAQDVDAFIVDEVREFLGEIIVDQFARSRDGDRFFYENDQDLLDLFPEIGLTRLADVILRNSAIDAMPANVFVVPEPSTLLLGTIATLMATRWRRQS